MMPLQKFYDSLEQVTIIGNADGDWLPSANGVSITFNATQHKNTITICNGPYAGVNAAFTVERSNNDAIFVQILTTVADSLVKRINCWPSSGLVTAVMSAMVSKTVYLTRMSLLPSLARSINMEEAETLPCMVHNWLGERRIALGIALTHPHLHWPDLYVKPKFDTTIVNPEGFNPFSALLGEQNDRRTPALKCQVAQPDDYIEQLNILQQIASLEVHFWLESANINNLLECEKLFYNPTPENGLSNWFLMDFNASQYLDDIRHHLAYCQQILAFKALRV
ncbi:hypothetical protein [Shewanella sp. OMA3-2]|uniref:hypothetical protein n=1 Tax=Shewanella sp. OMA3-2 TaxID=2908650 RepID=UPI001F17C98A|nr:hypothetical protein [Shewanella sp. OMA3-2]UJF20692.1 hypothetical protein L0B17_10890 [Shewanella sp. OMA3-2]